jgi:hypothetical protein
MASNFLTCPAALAFLLRVRLGKEKKDQMSCRWFLHYIDPLETCDEVATVLAGMNKMAQHVRIIFGAFKPDAVASPATHAMHVVSLKLFDNKILIHGKAARLQSLPARTHFIVINHAYKHYITNSHPSPCEHARFASNRALSLVDEIAHTYHARNYLSGDEDSTEPFWSLEQHKKHVEPVLELEHLLFKECVNASIHPTQDVDMQ